ncbi:MAG: dUTP diphosphatase [Actinomycetota bacterium]|nr:dUTP diphosphatase [Actinomycetota bacterium]
MEIKIKMLEEGLPLPKMAHDGDAGCDLYSRIDISLAPGQRALVPTGVALSIPEGYAGFVQPRSGLALKHGITIVNTPGLIDSKYRGEICAIMLNTDKDEIFEIKRGERICQLVIQQVVSPKYIIAEELDDTTRGKGGFGSTGK